MGTDKTRRADAIWMHKQYLKFARDKSAPHWGQEMSQTPLFLSDTGQLRWDYGAGRFQFNAPSCQGLVGAWGGGSRDCPPSTSR